MDDVEFLNQLKKEFLDGMVLEIPVCEELVMEYEKSENYDSLIKLMRILHSLKGSAQAVDMLHVSNTLHAIETFCLSQKDKKIPTTSFVSQLLNHLDALKEEKSRAS